MINNAFPNFESASAEVLSFLNTKLEFGLWMVTRVESDDWIVLDAFDEGYGVKQGDVFRWTDSFCSRMVEGLGPCIAPKSQEIPVYADAPIGQQVPIGSYIGIPLNRRSGELFGTLCAIDPQPMPVSIRSEQVLVETMGRLLMTVLESELEAQEEHRLAERAKAQSMTDCLTGLFNRHGWQELLEIEDHRCQRYGHPACILSIDLDELKQVNDEFGHSEGDALLRRTAEVLKTTARQSEILARLGGDEFAILAVECDAIGGKAFMDRLHRALDDAGVAASIGMTVRHASESLAETLERADRNMYADKRQRKCHESAEADGVACGADG